MGIEQRHVEVHCLRRDHQPGDATTAPEVEAGRCTVREEGEVPERMVEVVLHRPGAEEADIPGEAEDVEESAAGRLGQDSSGSTTTRRRGSTPSDVVATPSIPLAVS